MKNPIIKAMDPNSHCRGIPQRKKSLSGGTPYSEMKDKDKKSIHTLPSLRTRRGSVDSAFAGMGKHSLTLHKERSSLSDSMDKKPSEKKCSFVLPTPKRDTKDKTQVKESKYSLNRISLSSNSKTDSSSDLKPILKSCTRLASIRASLSCEDVSASTEEKLHTNDSGGKFCYRLPLSKSPIVRKSVSFRDELEDEHKHHKPRRYSSPSLQLPSSFAFPASKHFTDAVNS